MGKLFVSLTVAVVILACILPSINQNICPCQAQAQSISDLAEIYSSLSPQTQQDLLNLIGTQTTDNISSQLPTVTEPVTTQPLPHGRDALRYFIKNNPGQRITPSRDNVKNKIQAAVQGYPNYGEGSEIKIPEDRDDFWDRVKKVFLGALIDAFANMSLTSSQ